MNTIPVTFNQHLLQATVLGGTVKTVERLPLSVILLNRSGSTFRMNNIEHLDRFGFRQIVCVEKARVNYNLEDTSRRFPHVKFIVPSEEGTPGDMVNLGMNEVPDGEVLVMWDTVSITSKLLTHSVAARLDEEKVFCKVPLIASRNMELLPINMIPHVNKGILSVDAVIASPEGTPTFYPFDYMGIYNRQKFILSGGYDYSIKSPFWQNLDLAMRAWLWGEKILVTTQIRLNYESDVPVEDATPDMSQLRFYLKNLAPKFLRDYAYIPKVKFLSYMIRSGTNFSEALENFKEARSWVRKNKYLFRTDAVTLINSWGEKEK